jgi:hypothetical protein
LITAGNLALHPPRFIWPGKYFCGRRIGGGSLHDFLDESTCIVNEMRIVAARRNFHKPAE